MSDDSAYIVPYVGTEDTRPRPGQFVFRPNSRWRVLIAPGVELLLATAIGAYIARFLLNNWAMLNVSGRLIAAAVAPLEITLIVLAGIAILRILRRSRSPNSSTIVALSRESIKVYEHGGERTWHRADVKETGALQRRSLAGCGVIVWISPRSGDVEFIVLEGTTDAPLSEIDGALRNWLAATKSEEVRKPCAS